MSTKKTQKGGFFRQSRKPKSFSMEQMLNQFMCGDNAKQLQALQTLMALQNKKPKWLVMEFLNVMVTPKNIKEKMRLAAGMS